MKSLFQLNRFIREQRGKDADTACDIFRQGGLVEISIASKRCKYDVSGHCSMCNYGIYPFDTPSVREVRKVVDRAIGDRRTKRVLFSTNGSFLDVACISLSLQQYLFQQAALSSAGIVIIETHVNDVVEETLVRLKSILRNKTVILEMGIESASEYVRTQCHLKPISTERILDAIKLCNEFGIRTQLNVMVGALFLDENEAVMDARCSLRWGLEHADYVCLFPANVKPYTLMMEAYRLGMYQPVSLWSVASLLAECSSDELERIDVAWYGNRSIRYPQDAGADETVMPKTCDNCHDILMTFYDQYASLEDRADRKELIRATQEAVEVCGCGCGCRETLSSAWEETPAFRQRIVSRQRVLVRAMASARSNKVESKYA